MPDNNLRFVDALVVTYSERSKAFYAYSNKYPNDIIIDTCYCPGGVNLVGKWIEVGVDYRARARDLVKIIEDKLLTRIVNGFVEVKVELQYDGMTNDNLVMFRNSTFGYICDSEKVLYDTRNGVSYHVWIVRFKREGLSCRWRVSTEQESVEPYFPNPTSSSTRSEQLTTVVGIVTSHAKMGEFWLVWSPVRPRSTICLDYNLSNDENVLGKWAELSIDCKHRVQKPIRIIRDLFETRVIAGLTEFRISFQHTKRYKRDFEMFYHHYFGDISDSFSLLESVEKGAWYTGWIVYSHHIGANSCWRLAIKQQIQGPFKQSPEVTGDRSYQRNGDLNEQSSGRVGRRRSRSNDSRNSFNDMENNRMRSHRRYSSPDVINEYDRISPTSRRKNNDWRNDRRNMENSSLDNSLNNLHITDFDKNDDRSRYREYSPKRKTKDQSISENHHNDNYQNYSTSSNHSSSIGTRHRNEKPLRDDSDEYCRDDDTHLSRKTKKHSHRQKTERKLSDSSESQYKFSSKSSEFRKRSISPVKTSEKQDRVHTERRKESSKHSQSDSPEVHESIGVSKAEQDKEIHILRNKLSRISELVLSLTADDSVSIPMKLWSIEDYEKLMKIVKTYAK